MKNDSVDNPNYANIDEYNPMLSFDDRVTHGLRMDRSFFNHNPIFDLATMQSGDIKDMRKANINLCYKQLRRINSWSLKKRINLMFP